MRTAFDGCCSQLLVHRFPSHPDFDPNGRGVALKPNELDVVLGVVEQAAQDKVGRYEVPRHDIPTVKKIANPLGSGSCTKSAFVLSREWPDLLTRKAGGAAGSHRRAAARLDRRGAAGPARAGAEPAHRLLRGPGRQGVAAGRAPGSNRPSSTRSPMTWCSAARSCRRRKSSTPRPPGPQGIFRIPRQPVRTARSVHALADAIRRNARGRLDAAKDLAAELDRHAATLGLNDDTDRQATSRAADRAARPSRRDHRRHADGSRARSRRAPKDNAFYHAHLDSAERLTTALRQVNWQVLDDLAAADG